MAASISFQAAAITSGSSSSRSLSFIVASAAGQERLVALCAIANASPGAVTFTSVAIDGQSATLVGSYARATDANGNGPVVAFFRAAGTANTSINVTCTISTGAVFDCRGAVWTLNDAGSLLASTGDTTVGAGNIGSLDLNVNTVIDGAAAAFVLAYACGTRNITWSGLTERADGSTPLYSGDWHSAADLIVGSSSTPLTITATLPTTFDSNSAVAGVVVSFNPVEAGTDGGGDVGQQIIDIGDAIDDGTGDPARVAFDKCNDNFTELYAADTNFLTTAVAATTYQPLDADLTAIAALAGTNNIYYRSGTDTWTPVTIGSNLTFAAGVLDAVGGSSGNVAIPQGRLTLQTVTPVMITTQAAKTTIYYTPYTGMLVPIYSGTVFTMTSIGAELSQTTTDTTKSPAAVAANSLYDLFVWSDGGTMRCTRGPAWTSATARSAGTALVMVNGILLNNAAITNGPAAQRGTYVGTVRSNGSSQIDYQFGSRGTNGGAGIIGVWNCYNRADVIMRVQSTTASWTYNSTTIRNSNASATWRVSFVAGLEEDQWIAVHEGAIDNAPAGSTGVKYVGLDGPGSTAYPSFEMLTLAPASGQVSHASLTGSSLGFHYVQAGESGNANIAGFYGADSCHLTFQWRC